MELWSWRVGLGIKSVCCSSRGPAPTSGRSQPPRTSALGDPTPSHSGLHRSVCIFTHKHIHKNKIKFYKNRWTLRVLTWEDFPLSTLFPEQIVLLFLSPSSNFSYSFTKVFVLCCDCSVKPIIYLKPKEKSLCHIKKTNKGYRTSYNINPQPRYPCVETKQWVRPTWLLLVSGHRFGVVKKNP